MKTVLQDGMRARRLVLRQKLTLTSFVVLRIRNQRRCSPAVFVLAALLLTMNTVAEAAQVTFQFDATVTDVRPANSFVSPVVVHVGDVIQGTVAFDPALGSPFGDNAFDSNQGFPWSFNINGSAVGSSQYGIRIINDSPVFDSPFPTDIADEIVLACSPSSAQVCSPALISLPGLDPFRLTARLALLGEDAVFDTPHVSAETSIWNALTFERSLRLTFDNLIGGSVLVDASVGRFSLVPEATTISIALLYASFWLCNRKGTR